MTWTMPAEFAPQERIWMAFPRVGNTLGDDAASADEARDAWAAVANAVAGFEPVTMVVDPSAVAEARTRLSGEIELVEAPLDDYWMRDIGPTFVLDDERRGSARSTGPSTAGARTRGRRGSATTAIAELRRRRSRAPTHLPSTLVNEGGGIHVDGEGTVLLTETVQLDPRRNPYADQGSASSGSCTARSAPRASSGSRAASPATTSPSARAATSTWSRRSPRPAACCCTGRTTRRTPTTRSCGRCAPFSKQATDAAGRRLEIIDLPAPETLRDEEGFVDWNYVNHLVVNGGVIACGYGEPRCGSPRRAAILGDAYGREVVTIDARPILARGGGIHCITQQQPESVAR